MPEIDLAVICHRLCINPHKPVVKKRRDFNHEQYEAINKEVKKLLAIGFIREVNYLEWCTNVVLVKKANDKLRVCTDYKLAQKTASPYP